MNQCIAPNCDLRSSTEDKCILHCSKKNLEITDMKLEEFTTELISYILRYILNSYVEGEADKSDFNEQTLKNGLCMTGKLDSAAITYLKRHEVLFENLIFPKDDANSIHTYLNVLQRLGTIHFKNCEFWTPDIAINEDIRKLFENCRFRCTWKICNSKTFNNQTLALYKSCIFEKVSLSYEGDGNYIINTPLFQDCEFDHLEFSNITFTNQIFNNNKRKDNKFNVNHFSLQKCIIEEKLLINDCNIQFFELKDSEFKSKFEFKNNLVHEFVINNSNFTDLVDTYETKYIKFTIKKSIFKEFVGFENCVFGNDSGSENNAAKFIYATFLGFVNFRNTIFQNGLDIKNINLKEPPNFLDTKIDPTNTNRETFRIVKNSFDKIGNVIEANRFYVHEMKKYRHEIKYLGSNQEKFILFFNDFFSDFGQSYIKPIIGILISAIMYYLLQKGYQNNIIYTIYPPFNEYILMLSTHINGLAKSMTPFALNKFLHNGLEAISLFFYVINSCFIWLTIVAIKRRTKR